MTPGFVGVRGWVRAQAQTGSIHLASGNQGTAIYKTDWQGYKGSAVRQKAEAGEEDMRSRGPRATGSPVARAAALSRARERLFRVSVMLKGLHAALEIAGGVALLTIGPQVFLRVVAALTQDELAEDRRDLIAHAIYHAAQNLALGGKNFVAFYLLSHGIIKILLVGALLKRKLWAYPLAEAVFAAFIAYQLYRYSFTRSIGLIALSVFDAVVLWLIWLEYRAMPKGHTRQ